MEARSPEGGAGEREGGLRSSERLGVLRAGRVGEFGTPLEIYKRPKTRFAATFVGTLNTLAAKIGDPKSKTVTIDGQSASLDTIPASANAARHT